MGLRNDHHWLALGTLVLTLGVFSGSASAQYKTSAASEENPFQATANGEITALAGGLDIALVSPPSFGLVLPGQTLSLKPGESVHLQGVPFFVDGEQLTIGTYLPPQRAPAHPTEVYEAAPFLNKHEQEN